MFTVETLAWYGLHDDAHHLFDVNGLLPGGRPAPGPAGSLAIMGEDIRVDQLRSRHLALGCAWLFLAVPGIFGIIVLLESGGTSVIGWVLGGLYVVGTGYLGFLFVRAGRLSVAPMESRSGWIGQRRT